MTLELTIKEYQVPPTRVKVWRAVGSGEVYTNAQGADLLLVPFSESYYPGDWIVETPNGIKRVWTNEKFQKSYELRESS